MRVTFLDMEDGGNPLNGKLIESCQELEGILDKSRHREPFGLKLDCDNGTWLDVCLAETFGSVQYTTNDRDPAYLVAVKPGCAPLTVSDETSPHTLAFLADRRGGVESPEFLVGGTRTPIPTRYVLPYDLVRRIAVHYLETSERLPDLSWEQI